MYRKRLKDSARISSFGVAGVLSPSRSGWSSTAAGRTIVNERCEHPTTAFAAAAPCMPLLRHTVAEHGLVIIVKSSARSGEDEDCDSHGADGNDEVEAVDEEKGVASLSEKYSCCWKEREKKKAKDGQTDGRCRQLENGSTQKTRAENAHVQLSRLLTTAFAKIAWWGGVGFPPPCASSTAPRVPPPLPTSRGCASWDSSRRNRGPFIRQERARRILFAQVFANCRPPQKGFPRCLLEHGSRKGLPT